MRKLVYGATLGLVGSVLSLSACGHDRPKPPPEVVKPVVTCVMTDVPAQQKPEGTVGFQTGAKQVSVSGNLTLTATGTSTWRVTNKKGVDLLIYPTMDGRQTMFQNNNTKQGVTLSGGSGGCVDVLTGPDGRTGYTGSWTISVYLFTP